ncbi:IclR family transcriptional regulator [Acuticoccus sp.]|uniref:IclR family transcriptional regulator n=1 Tax=Acuticoccus sp. TaxID=1904378 RepID=UPI003B52CAD8
MDSAVKSAGRVLDILELFEAEQRPLRVSEIVAALNLPQSSVSMLVKTMRQMGYIDFDPVARTYRPSVRLAFLGHWAVGPRGTTERINATMRALSEATGESVLLGRQVGINMQYLSVIESRQLLRFSLHPGLVRTSFHTGIGIAILSRRPDDEVRRLVTRYNAERAEGAPSISEAWVAGELQRARADGFYQSHGMMTPGAGVIAVPLPEAVFGPNLGIGIGAPLQRLEARRDALVARLQEAVLAG